MKHCVPILFAFGEGRLALACLLILFVALASDQQEDRRRAKWLRSAADLIKEHHGELTKTLSGGVAAPAIALCSTTACSWLPGYTAKSIAVG